MKKYTNKILVVAGIVLVLVFAITFFLTFRELKSSGRLTTYKELGTAKKTYVTPTGTITVDVDSDAEEIEEQ